MPIRSEALWLASKIGERDGQLDFQYLRNYDLTAKAVKVIKLIKTLDAGKGALAAHYKVSIDQVNAEIDEVVRTINVEYDLAEPEYWLQSLNGDAYKHKRLLTKRDALVAERKHWVEEYDQRFDEACHELWLLSDRKIDTRLIGGERVNVNVLLAALVGLLRFVAKEDQHGVSPAFFKVYKRNMTVNVPVDHGVYGTPTGRALKVPNEDY